MSQAALIVQKLREDYIPVADSTGFLAVSDATSFLQVGVSDSLGDLSDVTIAAPADGNVLGYDSTTGLWGAVSIGTIVNPFDQNLNTTDSPTFNNLTISGSGINWSATGLSIYSSTYSWVVVGGSRFSFQNGGTGLMHIDRLTGNTRIGAAGLPGGTYKLEVDGHLNLNGGTLYIDGTAASFGGDPLPQALGTADSPTFAGLTVDTITSKTTNGNLTLTGDGTGVVVVNDDLNVTGKITAGSLDISGTGTLTFSSGNDIVFDVGNLVIVQGGMLQLESFTTTERNALTPSAGWIFFNSTTGQFEGWNGSAWVVLG